METNDMIKVLAADARLRTPPQAGVWWAAAGLAVVLAAAVFFTSLGLRPDFQAAAGTLRFVFKFAVTAILAGTAFFAVRALSRPGAAWRRLLPYLAIGPALLLLAVLLELLAVPQAQWTTRLVGVNSMVCLTSVPLIGIGPLAVFLFALRHGAPTRPGLAGAVAGLLAGGVAAFFYGAHCTDDSPLFVATWYTLAIAMLAVLGALAAPRIARW